MLELCIDNNDNDDSTKNFIRGLRDDRKSALTDTIISDNINESAEYRKFNW